MPNNFQSGIHYVNVFDGKRFERWVVICARNEAESIVQRQLSPEHKVRLSDVPLTPHEAAKFKLRAGEACKVTK